MKDPGVLRQALLQTILALKDATSLPWSAVRSAWATSMHELEESLLTWADATQSSLNRLSASQMSMANSNIATTSITTSHLKEKFANISMTVRVDLLMTITMATTDTFVLSVHVRDGIWDILRSNVRLN